MTLSQFNALDQQHQMQALADDGLHVGTRRSRKQQLFVFQLHDFYVEACFDETASRVIGLRLFTDPELLEPYLHVPPARYAASGPDVLFRSPVLTERMRRKQVDFTTLAVFGDRLYRYQVESTDGVHFTAFHYGSDPAPGPHPPACIELLRDGRRWYALAPAELVRELGRNIDHYLQQQSPEYIPRS